MEYHNIELLRSALEAKGYNSTELQIEGRGYVQFKSPHGACWVTHNRKINYPFTSAAVENITKYKPMCSAFVQSLGISTPSTYVVPLNSELADEQITEWLNRHGRLIVKPDNASLSKGLTLDIQTADSLHGALKAAYVFSANALVQNQVFGEEIRFTVYKGKAVSALLRRTPRIQGDGVATVAELITHENQLRGEVSVPYLTYPMLEAPLIAEAWLTDQTVPAPGEVVELGRGTMIRTGASVYEIIDDVHQDYRDIAQRIATELGVPYLAVDIMLQDYSAPASKENYWFIECNTSPVIKMYYSCRDGKMFDALNHIVPLIDETLALQAS